MNWIDRANEFGNDYHGLLGGVGAGAGVISAGIAVVGYFQDRSERRKMLGQLAAIREYLKSMDIKIDNLLNQNQQILASLDDLPKQFYQIASRVVLDSEVDKSYSFLRGLRNTFYELDDETRYELSSGYWRDVSQLLTYVYESENRLSHNATLASFGEFAIALTGGAATGFVSKLVGVRVEQLNHLHPILEAEAETALANLESLLKNNTYVQSHNFSQGPISELNISYFPDRTMQVTKYREVCVEHGDPGCCRYRKECKLEAYQVDAPDTEFTSRRNQYALRVEDAVENAKQALKNVLLSSWSKSMFVSYFNVLNEESLLENNLSFDGAFSLVPARKQGLNPDQTVGVLVVEKASPEDAGDLFFTEQCY